MERSPLQNGGTGMHAQGTLRGQEVSGSAIHADSNTHDEHVEIAHGHGFEHRNEQRQIVIGSRPQSQNLTVAVLGQFGAQLPAVYGMRPVRWGHGQAGLLLKRLVAAPQYTASRDEIVDNLWPEHDAVQGYEALRHALTHLRRALDPSRSAYSGSTYLVCDRDAIALQTRNDGTASIWIDRKQFELLATEAMSQTFDTQHEGSRQRTQSTGGAALALYHGDFLPTDLHRDWTQPVRRQCRRLWTALLRHLAILAVQDWRLDLAMLLLGQLVDAVPDDDENACLLMVIQAMAGHRGDAIRTYRNLETHLAVECELRPSAPALAICRAILNSEPLDEWIDNVRRSGHVSYRLTTR